MRLNKDDIYSLIGTVAFHGVILLILWFTVLKTEVPDEDGGVLVNFGNVDAAAGVKGDGQELFGHEGRQHEDQPIEHDEELGQRDAQQHAQEGHDEEEAHARRD